jgi:hypothetical protein
MSDIRLDVPTFYARAQALLTAWKVRPLLSSSTRRPPPLAELVASTVGWLG